MPQLFVAYLGGKTNHNRIGEDHETVLVVAENRIEAKSKAKQKWQGVGAAHLDVLVEVEVVDGYKIHLERISEDQKVSFEDDWEKLNNQ